MHNDGTGHKGTELMNLIANVLIENNKLKTICLATLSANNCDTARLCVTMMSEKIIATAKEIGFNNKKQLFHHFGHCFNHQQDGLCNAVAIGWGIHIGDKLTHDIQAFAPQF